MVGVVGHGAAELLHGGGRFLQRAGGALGAAGQVLVALGDLGAGDGHAVGAGVHGAHHFLQAVGGVVHVVEQVADLVLALVRDTHGQIALGDGIGHAAGLHQRAHDHAAHQPPPHQRQHGHGAQPQRSEDGHELARLGHELVLVGAGGIDPVPRRVVAEHGQLVTLALRAGIEPGVGDHALLALEHLAHEGRPLAAALGLDHVLALRAGVHGQQAVGLRIGAQHEVVAAAAHLELADGGL